MQKITKYLLISVFIFLSVKAFPQKYKKSQNLARYDFQKIHFGFTLGINELNFNLQKNSNTITNDTLKTIYTKSQKGFNLGIVSNLRLGKYTDLRFVPALIFGERQLEYGFLNNANSNNEKLKKIESTLLEFPVYLKYKSERYNNFRAYIMSGIKYSMDIASQDEIDDEGQEIVKLKKNDLMGEIGFGLDFYLEYFKFSPQIKISHGLINLLTKDQSVYTQSINGLRTNGWMLSFTFE
ncbi:MAG: hypothetical protein CMD19_06270 [Flavobacteriales bacterium]|nr:hypothetical protein [Flavobacteriales bacterium]|tara:strand:- start:876 stop:1589 length:714 start_codon:yes stop_codon:yes gene_type:complete